MQFLQRRVLVVALLVVAITTAGCHSAPRASTLDVVGCGAADVRRVPITPSDARTATVLDVITDCPTVNDPVERAARAAWFEIMPADAEAIRIRTAGEDSPATVITRGELQGRYGNTRHREDDVGDLLWLLLPIASTVLLATLFLVARRAARAGFILIMISRR